MRWKNRRRSRNVKDNRTRRYASTGRNRSGSIVGLLLNLLLRKKGGKGMVAVLIIGGLVLTQLGINPLDFLQGQSNIAPPQSTARHSTDKIDDEMGQFVGVVLAETEDVWNAIYAQQGMRYKEPTLVLFKGQVQSACGFASAATGPFYCPGDSKIYIDLSFYEQLKRKFDAPGDFAQAYVIAHEVGHHIQNLSGILNKFHKAKSQLSEADGNALSVRVELQADCYAGVWAHFTNKKGLLDEGDLEEALNAAMQIGDDALQKRARGYVVPESFNHGTSEQRKTWFVKGFQKGQMETCDTFTGNV